MLLNEVEDMIGNMLKGLDSNQVADGNEANMAFEASKLQLGWLREQISTQTSAVAAVQQLLEVRL